jgi:uncharacterized protein (DUF433 family)
MTMWHRDVTYEATELAAWLDVPVELVRAWSPSGEERPTFWDAAVVAVTAELARTFEPRADGAFRMPSGGAALVWPRSYPMNDGRTFSVVGKPTAEFYDALSRAVLRIQWRSWQVDAMCDVRIGDRSPIVLSPDKLNGRPHVYGVATATIFDRYAAGETVPRLARSLGLEEAWIPEAIELERRARAASPPTA